MRAHMKPRPFVYVLKQALKQPQLWQIHARSVTRDGLAKWCTTQQEWHTNLNGVAVQVVWLRVGDGHSGNEGKELDLHLDGQIVRLTPYESEKLFKGCEQLQQHFLRRVERSKKKRLADAISKLEEATELPAKLVETPVSTEVKAP